MKEKHLKILAKKYGFTYKTLYAEFIWFMLIEGKHSIVAFERKHLKGEA